MVRTILQIYQSIFPAKMMPKGLLAILQSLEGQGVVRKVNDPNDSRSYDVLTTPYELVP